MRLPSAFDNKLVRVRATVVSGFEVFGIRDPEGDCDTIWLTYDEGGPVASVSSGQSTPASQRKPITLIKDRNFKQFQELLNAEMYSRDRGTVCIACNRYEVTATMTGRVDYAGTSLGFGHLNAYHTQFVLQTVDGVAAKDLSSNYDQSLFSSTPVRFPTAYLTGKVVNGNGKAVRNAEVNVHSTEDVPKYMHDFTDWTDEEGKFKFSVPPGRYVLGVNLEIPPSPSVPFPPTYFPSALDERLANVVSVRNNEHRDHLTISMRNRLTEKVFPVEVVWPDGRAAADANVCLKEVNDPMIVVGTSVSHTREDGTFDLIGFLGIAYVLHADIYLKPMYKLFCAQNVIIGVADTVDKPIIMRLTKTGDVCKNMEYTANGVPLSELTAE
jgi:hypothetical protein